ncbi:hypothetical protein HNV12_07845 [Methanococcoides sp. SA1]|nr:hypothetical protein [Methanococcoides sp. SA1]
MNLYMKKDKDNSSVHQLRNYPFALFLISFLLFLMLANISLASEYYVSTNGNNGDNGLSIDHAWATPSYAALNVEAGDTIVLLEGTWNGDHIKFNSSGNLTHPIVLTSYNGMSIINSNDTVLHIDKDYIEVKDITIVGTTTKDVNFNDVAVVPVIKIENALHTKLEGNIIKQIGFGGYSLTNPEQGGVTPAVFILSSKYVSITNNEISSQNIRSEGICLQSSTKSTIINNIIDSRHYLNINVKDTTNLIYYDHVIQNNIGYDNKNIYYFYDEENSLLNVEDPSSIFVAASNNITIQGVSMVNSEGIIFKSVTNSCILNYSNTRTNVGVSEGILYPMIKSTLVHPIYLYNSDFNQIEDVDINLGGRHNYGVYFYLSNSNFVNNFTYESKYLMGGDGHNDALEIGYGRNQGGKSVSNSISNFSIKSNTWSDYPIRILNGAEYTIIKNGTIVAISGSGEGAVWLDDAKHTYIENLNVFVSSGYDCGLLTRHYNENNTVVNSIFNSASSHSIYGQLVGKDDLHLHNVSVNKKIELTGDQTVSRKWVVNVDTTDEFNYPLNNVNISIISNSDIELFNGSTNINGNLEMTLLQYMQNSSGTFYSDYSDFTLVASKPNFDFNVNKITLDSNVYVKVSPVLQDSNPAIDDSQSVQETDSVKNSYYVSLMGKDTNDGLSSSTAWRSINRATSNALPGDIIYVASGNYGHEYVEFLRSGNVTDWIELRTSGGSVSIEGDGTGNGIEIYSNSYISISGDFKISNYSNGIFMDSCTNVNISDVSLMSLSTDGIYFRNSSYINLENVTIKDASEHGVLSFGYPYDNAINQHILISNSTIDGTSHNGIDLHTNNKYVSIINNHIYNVTNSAAVFSHNSGNENILVESNTMDNNQRGIWFVGTNNSVIKNNNIQNSYRYYGILLYTLQGYPGISNITIENNIISNSAAYDIYLLSTNENESISNITFISNSNEKPIKMNGNNIYNITVTESNCAPVMGSLATTTVTETDQLAFILSATDSDNDALTHSATNLPTGATLDSTTGEFSWIPSVGQAGTYSVIFEVTDGNLTDSETVIITVNSANDGAPVLGDDLSVNNAPVITTFGPANNAVFEAGNTINIGVIASDADGDDLTYLLKVDGATVSTTSGYVWTTDSSNIGAHTIGVVVSDGVDQATDQHTITVQNVADVGVTPVVMSSSAQIVAPGQPFSIGISIDPSVPVSGAQLDLLFDEQLVSAEGATEGDLFDRNGASTLFNSGTIGGSGVLSDVYCSIIGASPVSSKGTMATIAFTAGSTAGVAEFGLSDVVISNARSEGTPYAVTDTTVVIDTAPVLSSIGDRTVDEQNALSFVTSASDADGDSLTYSATGLPAGATYNTASGAFSWTPSEGQEGTYDVTFEVNDGYLADSKTICITAEAHPRWDVNRDCVVNILDITLVSQKIGADGTGTDEDVNQDGLVNIQDLTLVAQHFGETLE